MKIQIRRGVFETNSSSTHTLSIYKPDDWERFKKGELVIENFCSGKLVERDKVNPLTIYNPDASDADVYYFSDYDYITYEVWANIWSYTEYGFETIEEDIKDSSDNVVAHVVSYYQYG